LLSNPSGKAGETDIIDSLKNELLIAREDTTQVNILLNLFWQYRRTKPDTALFYAEQAYQVSNKSDNKTGLAKSLYRIGTIHKFRGDFTKAFDFFNRSKNLFEILENEERAAICLMDISAIYQRQKKYLEALENLQEAQQIFTAQNNMTQLARIYNMLGNIYSAMKQYDKSLEYHKKSFEINNNKGFDLGMSVNLNNIGNVYFEMKQYRQAIDNYEQSLEIKKKINDEIGISTILNNLGRTYMVQQDFTKAIEFLNKALNAFRQKGDKYNEALCLVNLGHGYLNSGNYDQSIGYSKKGLELAVQMNFKEVIQEAYSALAESYAATSQYNVAYEYYRLFKIYSDSLLNEEVVRTVTEMESKFEVEKKEKEIALLNSEKEKQELKIKQQESQRKLMIGFILLVVIVLIFLVWGYVNKQKLNRKLHELNLVRSRFFANISHEFRTPLTLLLGPLEKLLGSSSQEDKELIGMMHRNATRLLFLDNQLLDLSKIEAGKLSLKVSQSDIAQALKGMVMSFQSMAEKKNIDFKYKFPDKEIQAFFDQDKLEKIVYNLLSNALKFTPEKGQVVFELSLISEKAKKELVPKFRKIAGQIVCISVRDSGPGISKEHLPFIFDRFYQIDSTKKSMFDGTGLGLSLSKELVELHHGRISVQSDPDGFDNIQKLKGMGSVFTVYLPFEKKAFEPIEIALETEESSEFSTEFTSFSGQNKSKLPETEKPHFADISEKETIQILIVEDNPDMRLYIRDCFTRQYNVQEAADGKSGFEMATEKIPDIIITDLMMPEMDGIELCKKLKTDERTSHIPVILLTALASVEDRIRGLETGADDYIAKPFNRKELVTRVQNLHDQRNILRERFAREVKIQPKDIAVTSADEDFLTKLISFIEKNIADPDLNVDSLTEQIHLSRSQLHRKLKALTGLSSTEFIRTIRLKRAAQLLEQHPGTIAETVYAVGFNNLSYFSRCFQKQFNMTPKDYIDQS